MRGGNSSLFHWYALTLIWAIKLISVIVSCLQSCWALLCSSLWIPTVSATPLKTEAACLLSTLMNELEERWRRWFWSLRVCMEMRIVGLDSRPFLVFTSNPLGTSCHSLFLSVHSPHLSLPHISLSHIPSCTVLIFISFWLTLFIYFFKSDFYFQLSPLFPYRTLG